LGFCLLSFTFITLPAYRQAGKAAVGGRHSNEFPACSNTRTLAATLTDTSLNLNQIKYERRTL